MPYHSSTHNNHGSYSSQCRRGSGGLSRAQCTHIHTLGVTIKHRHPPSGLFSLDSGKKPGNQHRNNIWNFCIDSHPSSGLQQLCHCATCFEFYLKNTSVFFFICTCLAQKEFFSDLPSARANKTHFFLFLFKHRVIYGKGQKGHAGFFFPSYFHVISR